MMKKVIYKPENSHLAIQKYVQRNITFSSLERQFFIPYQSIQQFPDNSDIDEDERRILEIANIECFTMESLHSQNYFLSLISQQQSNRIKIQIDYQPQNYSLSERLTDYIVRNKKITKIHLKFHYQMLQQDVDMLDAILNKQELIEFKLTIENNQVVTEIFETLKDRLSKSDNLTLFSLEIMNHSIKSNDTQILSEAISKNKSLKEIEIVSYFLIHEYQLLVQGLGSNETTLEKITLDLTYATDIVSDVLVCIGNQLQQMKKLKEICLKFNHQRIIDNISIINLLQSIYSHPSIYLIDLQFPFTQFDYELFTPFKYIARRQQSISLSIDIKIASDSALDYILQIFRHNYFHSIDIKKIKGLSMRSTKLINSQLSLDTSLQKLFLQCSFQDFINLDEGLKKSQLGMLSLTLKQDTIDFNKLKDIGQVLYNIPRISNIELIFYETSYDVRHLNKLIVDKLQMKPELCFMSLSLFKFSTKQDQLVQFIEENINSRIILDITPAIYSLKNDYQQIINLMCIEQLILLDKIQLFNKHISNQLQFNPIIIFADLYID